MLLAEHSLLCTVRWRKQWWCLRTTLQGLWRWLELQEHCATLLLGPSQSLMSIFLRMRLRKSALQSSALTWSATTGRMVSFRTKFTLNSIWINYFLYCENRATLRKCLFALQWGMRLSAGLCTEDTWSFMCWNLNSQNFMVKLFVVSLFMTETSCLWIIYISSLFFYYRPIPGCSTPFQKNHWTKELWILVLQTNWIWGIFTGNLLELVHLLNLINKEKYKQHQCASMLLEIRPYNVSKYIINVNLMYHVQVV